ncbi:ABC transporter ATP-binding protein [Demequina capsici]|uniref:ABC transporter ATP-binding protein n=1 Tax=Demequina capsici TaxID=3075620 RepID=A0AA96JD84_9MICO|nr:MULTISPECIES: ABC transporter ATP-binding protein [unclassified Demequina]WNM24419.1 ABC transporter ATP-binding protein [Demequina sp. OYTSA14]WNM27253.1 ABC transporter ATP-binding protein [Demequina sp. PMTSA13]
MSTQAEAATPLLEVDSVAKSYGALDVLTSVDLTVPAGQALGIVGPNGAGKSTLLSVINGTEKATAGVVRFAGRDVTGVGPADRARSGMGRTFQIPRPFTHLTVFENALAGASYGAGLHGHAADRRALEALEMADMLPDANTPAGTLPLLGRKRLELARALATDPQLLLLDEIAGGLTEAECDSLILTIRQLHSEGITIIWIEHVVKALLAVVERLVCLASGVIVADGEPSAVMRSPEVRQVYLGGGL